MSDIQNSNKKPEIDQTDLSQAFAIKWYYFFFQRVISKILFSASSAGSLSFILTAI